MRIHHDPDEWESYSESTPCSTCGGDLAKCNGACTGSTTFGLRRRPADDVRRIKAERQAKHEAEILAQADAIRARRSAI